MNKTKITFNKDLMTTADLKKAAEMLELLIKSFGQDLAPKADLYDQIVLNLTNNFEVE